MSAVLGGRPISVKYKRRMSVAESAGAPGSSLFCRSFADTNRSTGCFDQADSGGVGFRIGWKLHHFFRVSSVVAHDVTFVNSSAVGGLSRGSGIPSTIHFSKSAITALSSFGPFFGIALTSTSCRRTASNLLFSGLPAMAIGPSVLPLSIEARSSSANPPLDDLVELWQA